MSAPLSQSRFESLRDIHPGRFQPGVFVIRLAELHRRGPTSVDERIAKGIVRANPCQAMGKRGCRLRSWIHLALREFRGLESDLRKRSMPGRSLLGRAEVVPETLIRCPLLR